jgi:hypothetical protein
MHLLLLIQLINLAESSYIILSIRNSIWLIFFHALSPYKKETLPIIPYRSSMSTSSVASKKERTKKLRKTENEQ